MPNGYGKTAPSQENLLGRSIAPLGDTGESLLAVTTLLGLSAFGKAMLVANWPVFVKSRTGRSAPCRALCLAFLFFFIDLS